MTDQELADRIATLGGGEKIDTWFDVPVDNRYAPPTNADSVCVAFDFIRDWRTAGALISRAVKAGWRVEIGCYTTDTTQCKLTHYRASMAPIIKVDEVDMLAINLACAEALEAT